METTRAVVTIKEADILSRKELRSLAKWLTNTADFLLSEDVKKQGLSRRFTARYIQN